MKKTIFRAITIVSLCSMVLFALCAFGIDYYGEMRDAWNALRQKGYYVATAMELEPDGGTAYLNKIRGYEGRITLIAPDGTVLFDDMQTPSQMDNHAGREEVKQALANGTGEATRASGTLGDKYLYYAMRLRDGNVLRVAMRVDTVLASASRLLPLLLLAVLAVALLAAVAAGRITRRMLKPLNEMDLNDPLAVQTYPEISPLLRRIAAQNEKIDAQMAEMRRRQKEFADITGSLTEGLVVLDKDGNVLEINASARQILGVDGEEAVGRHILTLTRELALNEAVKKAAGGGATEEVLPFGEQRYRVSASPAVVDGGVRGVVLLFVDDTAKEAAEISRREFSANVSHELKTPLTSILGYAEMIKSGVAAKEDIPDFATRIHGETTRMIALVDDIIKLSRLDEKSGGVEWETLDLLYMANDVAQNLQNAAAAKNVALSVDGDGVQVCAVPGILYEVVYNLVDNAIRYNKEGGSVDVHVGAEGGFAKVRVADTGPGIGKEHAARIFERFYRVDKSHSKQSGGTGLGLSIAKHGAQFHGGDITLESSGGGAVFTLALPLQP